VALHERRRVIWLALSSRQRRERVALAAAGARCEDPAIWNTILTLIDPEK